MDDARRHETRMDRTDADRPDGAASQQVELDRLHAAFRELRDRLLRLKGDYEGGRLTLDEELVLVRGIERELVAVGLAIHDLAAERSSPRRPAPTRCDTSWGRANPNAGNPT